MSELLAKKNHDTQDEDVLKLNQDVLTDVKEVMKELKLFRSSKLDVVKNDLNLQKKEMKIVSRLQKLVELVKGKLPNEELAQLTCQLIEDYVWLKDKKKMNDIKRKIALAVLIPVLECTEDVAGIVVTLVCTRLKKSTAWRRNKHWICRIASNFFLP